MPAQRRTVLAALAFGLALGACGGDTNVAMSRSDEPSDGGHDATRPADAGLHDGKDARAFVSDAGASDASADVAVEGGGNDASADRAAPVEAGPAPVLSFVFPPSPGLTDAGEIWVRVSASIASDVAVLSVDGVPADLERADASSAVFRTRTRVPLARGQNSLEVVAALSDGREVKTSMQVRREPILSGPVAVVWDPVGSRFIVADNGAGVLTVDAAGVLGDIAMPPGPLTAMALDEQNGSVFTASFVSGSPPETDFYWVDLAKKVATRLVGSDGGGVSAPVYTSGMVFDAPRNRILAADRVPPEVVVMDPKSGSRTIVSDATRGSGLPLQSPTGIAQIDATHAAVSDGATNAIFEVDLVTGDRKALVTPDAPVAVAFDGASGGLYWAELYGAVARYDFGTQKTVSLAPADYRTFPSALAFDSTNGRLVLGSSGRASALVVSRAGSSFEPLVPSQIVGDGSDVGFALALVVGAGERAFVGGVTSPPCRILDLRNGSSVAPPVHHGAVLAAAPDTEPNRVWIAYDDGLASLTTDAFFEDVVSDYSYPNRVEPFSPIGLAFDGVSRTAYVTGSSTILAVDTGSRSTRAIVQSPLDGGARHFDGIAIDPSGRTLYVSDSDARAIYAIDPASQSVAVALGPDQLPDAPYGLAFDARRAELLVRGLSSIYGVDPASGAVRTLSATVGPGEGPHLDAISMPVSLSLDGNVVYTASGDDNAIVAVDAVTSDRIIVWR